MGSDNTKASARRSSVVVSGDASVLIGYEGWLDRQALSSASRRAYLRAVRAFVEYVAASDVRGDPFGDRIVGAHALRDFKRHRLHARAAPATVNLELAAIDTLYRSRGIDPPVIERLELPTLAPRALQRREQIELLRAVERRGSARDAAIAAILSYTAVRVSECAALDLEDVSLTARTGEVVVRRAKRDEYRRVPLNRAAREAIGTWMRERPEVEEPDGRDPLFVNRAGGRLSARSIGKLISQLGADARIEGLSPHVLRHTCLTNLVRDGRDIVLVAEVAGHRRLETTRRYTRPDAAALREAMEALPVDR